MDLIENYKRKKRIKNISIVMFSISLAILLNSLLNQTWLWSSIKSSVWEYAWIKKNIESKSDLYIENIKKTWNNIFTLKSSKDLIQVKTISLSIAYNPEITSIESKFLSIDWWKILDITKNNWFDTFIINFEKEINIESWEEILQLLTNKLWNELSNINIVWANFIDKENNNYNLTTSWISF